MGPVEFPFSTCIRIMVQKEGIRGSRYFKMQAVQTRRTEWARLTQGTKPLEVTDKPGRVMDS